MAHRQVTVLQGPPALLLSQLAGVVAADDLTEARRRLTSRLGCTLLAAGVAALFLGVPLLGGAGGAVAVLALVGAAVCGIIWRGHRARDLDDSRLYLVRDLTNAIQADLSPKIPMALTLRHGDCFRFGTVSNQHTEGSLLTGRVYFSDHEDPWLSLRARLQDGSVLGVRATEEGKRKRKPKRKYQKIQDRIREKVAVVLRVRPEEYPNLARLQPALDAQRLAEHAGLALTRVEVRGSVVRVDAATGELIRQQGRSGVVETNKHNTLTPDRLLALLAFIYSGLAQCRAEGGR